MHGNIAFLLVLAAVAVAVPSPMKTEKLLGTFTNSQNMTSEYTLVLGRYTYEESLRDCIETGVTPGRSLASLETEEEERFVMDLIVGYGMTERTWVGSKWDGNGSFIWESGVPFRDNVHWMPGTPRSGDNTTRVAFWWYNMTSAGFITQEDNNILTSICESHVPAN